jgi:hypothetical protein
MCPSGGTHLTHDCCFRELALYNQSKCVGSMQSGHHHHNRIEMELVDNMLTTITYSLNCDTKV